MNDLEEMGRAIGFGAPTREQEAEIRAEMLAEVRKEILLAGSVWYDPRAEQNMLRLEISIPELDRILGVTNDG